MRLKDIEPGEVYAVVRYYDKRVHGAAELGRLEAREWDTAYSTLFAARVIEMGVQVQHYSRPGVRVQRLDRQTLEPATDSDGAVVDAEGYLATNVLMPWEDWDRRWHEHVEAAQEAERARRERAERERERRQEEAARGWMEREFAYARGALEDVCAVLRDDEEALADVGNFPAGDVTDELRDRVLRAIVDRRNPDGNPYLNGTREAH